MLSGEKYNRCSFSEPKESTLQCTANTNFDAPKARNLETKLRLFSLFLFPMLRYFYRFICLKTKKHRPRRALPNRYANKHRSL